MGGWVYFGIVLKFWVGLEGVVFNCMILRFAWLGVVYIF